MRSAAQKKCDMCMSLKKQDLFAVNMLDIDFLIARHAVVMQSELFLGLNPIRTITFDWSVLLT